MSHDASTPAVCLSVHDHGGLGAIRTLGRFGVEVHATFLRDRDAARSSRFLHSAMTWDLDHEPAEATLETLISLGERVGRRAVLLASEDASAIFVAEHAERLRAHFLVPDQPAHLTRDVADKRRLHELCVATGTPSPDTTFPETLDEVHAFAARATYPVVIKAIGGWLLRGQSEVKTIIAADEGELLAQADAMAVDGRLNAMLQEYVPGAAQSIWTFAGYSDEHAETLVSFVGNKQREYPVDRGLTTLTECARNDEVEELARRFVKAIGYRGIIDLDFRLDARDGRYKALDFNPRPGANFRAFVGTNGIDVVRAAYLHLTAQPVPPTTPQLGRRWIVEHWDLAGARRYVADGRLTMGGWARSLRGVREGAWFARDDPQPFVRNSAAFVGLGARWAAGRVRARRRR